MGTRLMQQLWLLMSVVISLGCGQSWSEADRDNAAHIFSAFNHAQDAVEVSNRGKPYSVVTQEEIDEELGHLSNAIREANQVSDEFLDQRHSDFRRAFRELFQKSIQLRIEGYSTDDTDLSNRANRLYDDWIDWFNANKREMTLPRPSEVM